MSIPSKEITTILLSSHCETPTYDYMDPMDRYDIEPVNESKSVVSHRKQRLNEFRRSANNNLYFWAYFFFRELFTQCCARYYFSSSYSEHNNDEHVCPATLCIRFAIFDTFAVDRKKQESEVYQQESFETIKADAGPPLLSLSIRFVTMFKSLLIATLVLATALALFSNLQAYAAKQEENRCFCKPHNHFAFMYAAEETKECCVSGRFDEKAKDCFIGQDGAEVDQFISCCDNKSGYNGECK